MGFNLMGGYSQQSFKHKSLDRFVQSYNNFFGSGLETQLEMPTQFGGPVVGVELSAAIFRFGAMRRLNAPMRFEARHVGGSIRKMEISTPKYTGYFDLLMPIAKGKVFAGMTVGADWGYFELKSSVLHNFGRETIANGDGLSGMFRTHLDLQGRFGARLDINLISRLSISARAETYNTVINATESPMNGWRDEFYSDASLSNVRERRVYLAEDVTRRFDDYITLGNTQWETSPAVYGQPKGLVYTVTANYLIYRFSKKK